VRPQFVWKDPRELVSRVNSWELAGCRSIREWEGEAPAEPNGGYVFARFRLGRSLALPRYLFRLGGSLALPRYL
jgi:hypothetical protein